MALRMDHPVPVFRTQGVSNLNSTPGARAWGITSWTDASKQFVALWRISCFLHGNTQDLWKYDIPTNEWTWMKGPLYRRSTGYIVPRVFRLRANYPEGEGMKGPQAGKMIKDNLWLFGGYGVDALAQAGHLNDLWMYNIAINEWMWVAGESSATPGAGIMGQLLDPIPTSHPEECHTVIGKILMVTFGCLAAEVISAVFHIMIYGYGVTTLYWTWMNGSSAIDNT